MIRKSFIWIGVFALAALMTTTAFAGRGPGGGGGGGNCPGGGPGKGGGNPKCPYAGTQVEGEVASINAADYTFVLNTADGDVTVIVTEDTVVKKGRTPVSFDDIKQGQTVRACGELDAETLSAYVVTIRYQGR